MNTAMKLLLIIAILCSITSCTSGSEKSRRDKLKNYIDSTRSATTSESVDPLLIDQKQHAQQIRNDLVSAKSQLVSLKSEREMQNRNLTGIQSPSFNGTVEARNNQIKILSLKIKMIDLSIDSLYHAIRDIKSGKRYELTNNNIALDSM
jgi:hypothetical protein